MPVKKTDKKTTPAAKKNTPEKSGLLKKTPVKKAPKKTLAKNSGPRKIIIKRVAERTVTKKITNATKNKKVVITKSTKRRQTPEEMEYKLSMLRPAKDRPSLIDEVELSLNPHTGKKFSLPKREDLKLPSNMSLRSIKKAEVIRSLFSDDTVKAAQKVAYVSSATLIAFGIFFSFTSSDLLTQSQSIQAQTALVGAGTINGTAAGATKSPLQPTFELATTIPAEIVDDVQINFASLNVSSVNIRIESYGDGTITDISANAVNDTLYKFVIPGKTLAPGEHRLIIRLRSAQNTAVLEKNFTFVKPKPFTPESESLPEEANSDVPENNDEEADSSASETSSDKPVETLSQADNIIKNAVYSETLDILLPQTNLRGISIIGFNAPEDTTSVIVSIRNKSSLTTSRLGSANRSKLATNWQYLYDTRLRPDGEYELFAEAKLDSGKILKDSVNITVSNAINTNQFNINPISTLEDISEDSETDVDDSEPEDITLPVPRLPREFVPVTSEINNPDAESTLEQLGETTDNRAEAVGGLTREILTTNRDLVEDLYQRYSVALQSGDEMLIKAIESDINDANARFTTELLKDPNSNYYASDVDTALKERFETMKKRIIAFEEIRKTSSNQKSSTDTDSDGVSDFDEENLYFTDPNSPDTDNDGILDGIEIIRGFNPLNPSAEAIIAYESPKESFGLVREDVLKVSAVVPVLATDDAGERLPVQAEIKGVSLPNSFVTLFIFSTPVIVTVKTDDTGAFAYTFDRELEDGEHEVYVAVTDNAGAIIAQSNSFRFIKEAEAFTPQNNDDPLLAQTVSIEPVSSNPYNITIGFGILALGLILLMLGVGLRSKEEPILDNAPA